MPLSAYQERVKSQLVETVKALCRNSLQYKEGCTIEGLLGITIDSEEVILININEHVNKAQELSTANSQTVQCLQAFPLQLFMLRNDKQVEGQAGPLLSSQTPQIVKKPVSTCTISEETTDNSNGTKVRNNIKHIKVYINMSWML